MFLFGILGVFKIVFDAVWIINMLISRVIQSTTLQLNMYAEVLPRSSTSIIIVTIVVKTILLRFDKESKIVDYAEYQFIIIKTL